ncbi:MAG: hypothetical protein ACYC23_10435 [Limisphaerales bacterium]
MKPLCALLALALLTLPVRAADSDDGWFPFQPAAEDFSPGSAIDLRWLNEKQAGDGGFIAVKEGQFVHGTNGEVVRFWAVNGPSSAAKSPDDLRREARLLAKYGVNLVRIHGAVFDKNGEPDPAKVRHVHDIVEAMKAEGIYSHLSIYFPLWFRPSASLPWLAGYDGQRHPFAALFFNLEFQAKYREWWRTLLLTPSATTGAKLIDEPALFGVEMQNEDSYFFWTFSAENVPDPQLRLVEKQFGDWLVKTHGSLDAAFRAWNGLKLPRDDQESGRVALRPLWNLFNEKTPRDRDTAAFLLESQTEFYRATYAFLKSLGVKGLVTASNWTTASAEVLGPLEKLSYTVGDFLDRHGYFGSNHRGENAAWSIRDGHTFSDRSALRFDPESPGGPKLFVHPGMDVKYNGLPSMISETTWNRPNRFRSEAPLYFAAFGALQDSSAIVHFAFDGAGWNVKPNFFMQPWTLMSPAMMGQFPAAALLFRQGLVAPGRVLADVRLNGGDLKALRGTPLPQDASFDELRLKDLPAGVEVKPENVIDPLIHFAGQTRVTFTDRPGAVNLTDLAPFIDRRQQRVTASNGQLQLDYRHGTLAINAPGAQGLSGRLHIATNSVLTDVVITSPMDLGHVILVTLDGQPLRTSKRMLLQAMSEEQATGFATEPAEEGVRRIKSIGTDPWRVKKIAGKVTWKRADARNLKVTPLDLNGRPTDRELRGESFDLEATTIYYLIEAR